MLIAVFLNVLNVYSSVFKSVFRSVSRSSSVWIVREMCVFLYVFGVYSGIFKLFLEVLVVQVVFGLSGRCVFFLNVLNVYCSVL